MARKYTREELRERLRRSVYKVVTEDGIEGVTVRKVSKGCELSDPYIYQCYRDLFDLMETSFLEIDSEIAGMMKALIQKQTTEQKTTQESEETCWTLWSAYWRFYQSARYTREILKVRQQEYKVLIDYVETLGKLSGVSDLMDAEVIVSNIVDSTVSVAVKMHLGYMDSTALKERTIYQSVFFLLFHLLHIDVWNGEI